MQLTGKEIIERGIVTNYCKSGIQQQGVDVRLKSISKVDQCQIGLVPIEGKTRIPKYQELTPQISYDGRATYHLDTGYYEVTLEEACNIPSNSSLHYKTRSSLVRCGAIVHSGQFDAGFKTDAMGCFLQVIHPITIERGARIAQAIVFESNEVTNTYDGQWQEDQQRKQ